MTPSDKRERIVNLERRQLAMERALVILKVKARKANEEAKREAARSAR